MPSRPTTIAFLALGAAGWLCLATAAEKPKVSGYTVTAEGGVEGTQVIRYDAEGRPIDPNAPMAPKTTPMRTRRRHEHNARRAPRRGGARSSREFRKQLCLALKRRSHRGNRGLGAAAQRVTRRDRAVTGRG